MPGWKYLLIRQETSPTKSPNLDAYNAKVEVGARLPRIYFFHDELADWMADKSDARYRDAG